jgi:hypothetical protein
MASHGRYKDNSENRRLHRVGQEYGRPSVDKESQQKQPFDSSKFVKDDGLIDPVEAVIARFPELKHLVKRSKGEKPDVSAFTESAVREAGVDWDKARAFVESIYAENRKIRERQKQSSDEDVLAGRGTATQILNLYNEKGAVVLGALRKTPDKVLLELMEIPRENIRIAKDSDSIEELQQGCREVALLNSIKNEMAERMRAEREREKKEEAAKASKEADEEMKRSGEKYTKVRLEECPMSSKVNLKKYLSDKNRRAVDDEMESMRKGDIKFAKTVYENLVNKFNENFDSTAKAVRAMNLYRILQLKDIIEEKGKSSDGEIEKILGIRKGEPMSHEQADEMRANPNYKTGEFKYMNNCQVCVLAYEMRRRGYDVEAAPYLSDKKSVTYRLSLMPSNAFYFQKNSSDRPIPMESTPVLSGDIGRSKFNRAMWNTYKENLMYNTRAEGRYFLSVRWRKGNCGHVIMAERNGGILTFFDPQCGRYVDIEEYAGRIDARVFRIVRVDNLELNPDIIKENPILPIKH